MKIATKSLIKPENSPVKLPRLDSSKLQLSPRERNKVKDKEETDPNRRRASFSPRVLSMTEGTRSSTTGQLANGRQQRETLFKTRSTTAPNSNPEVSRNSKVNINLASSINITSSTKRIVPKKPSRAFVYKYYPGNNGRIILNTLRKRPWWRSAGKSEATKAKLIEKMEQAEGKRMADKPKVGGSGKGKKGAKEGDVVKVDERGEKETVIDYDFVWEMYRNPKRYKDKRWTNVVLNHLENNACLVSKKGLYKCIKQYCQSNDGIDMADIVPRTFYLPMQDEDPEANETAKGDYLEWLAYNDNEMANRSKAATAVSDIEQNKISFSSSMKSKNGKKDKYDPSKGVVWICKPASYANRGFGIKVVQGVDEVENLLQSNDAESRSSSADGDRPISQQSNSKALSKAAARCATKNGWICQEYMVDPLLVAGRKFDIRVFVMISYNKKTDDLRAYWFKDGYVRTSCKKYSLDSLADRECHLTNDAVQKKAKDYGKFENGNKLSYEEWQETIEKDYPHAPANVVMNNIIPKIKDLLVLSIQAAAEKLKKTQINKSFELLGYDFMVDSAFKPTLIEINSNPCLEFVNGFLEDLITTLLDNLFRQGLDSFFPYPSEDSRTRATQEAVEALEQEENKLIQLYP